MKTNVPPLVTFVLAASVFALAGCGGNNPAVEETLGASVTTVESGAEAIRQGVGQVVGVVTGGVVGKLVTDRNRRSLLREHRDMNEHMKRLEGYLRERAVALPPKEVRILQSTKDNLAAVGRQLEAERIQAGLGQRIYGQLDSARGTFNLFSQRYNAPPYTGHITLR